MQLTEMVTFVQDYIGETITGFRSTTQIEKWCRNVYKKIIRNRNDWNWLTRTQAADTVANQTTYELPGDFYLMLELQIDDSVWIQVPFHERHAYTNGNFFYILSTNQGEKYIHLLSTPTSAGVNNIDMVYLFYPSDILSTDTSEPAFHEAFHDIIPTFVCYLALRKEDDPTKEEFLKEYSDGFKRLLAWDRNNYNAGYKANDRIIPFSETSAIQDYRDSYA